MPKTVLSYGMVGGRKEGAAVEFVEGGYETGALEEGDQVGVVRVGGESVDEGGREDCLCRESGSGESED